MIRLFRPEFIYVVEHIAADGTIKSVERIHNLMPDVGLNYQLGAAYKGAAAYSNWYLGLFTNNYTPVAGDTMADFAANAGENSDYDGTARQTVTFSAVSGGAIDTTASPNVFDFTSTGATIRGAFLVSNSTWDGTTGILASAVLFSSAKVLAMGESLRVPVSITLANA